MHPILYQVNIFGKPITIGTYGVFIVLAIIIGVSIALLLGKRLNHDRDEIFNSVTLISCGGILGALLTGFLIFLPERIDAGFFTYPPVLVSWGGILGGTTTMLILRRTWNINAIFYSDLLTPSYITGIGIGRIGCHFAGCCFGIHTQGTLSIHFTHPLSPAAIMQQPLVPTQLISAGILIAAGLLFSFLATRYTGRGFLFFTSLIFYGIFRFTIEFWRADPRGFIGTVSDGQVFSLAAIMTGLVGLLILNKHYQAPAV